MEQQSILHAAKFLFHENFQDIVSKLIFLQKKGFTEEEIETAKNIALDLLIASVNGDHEISTTFSFYKPFWKSPRGIFLILGCFSGFIYLMHKFLRKWIVEWIEKRNLTFKRISDQVQTLQTCINELFLKMNSTSMRFIESMSSKQRDLLSLNDIIKVDLSDSTVEREKLQQIATITDSTIQNLKTDLSYSMYLKGYRNESINLVNEIRKFKSFLLKMTL